ncbi:MAG: hypothetical protein ACJAS0_001812 [Alcanivorax borkumensis]|jgi:hypothetical protein
MAWAASGLIHSAEKMDRMIALVHLHAAGHSSGIDSL